MSPWNVFNENLRTALAASGPLGKYVRAASIKPMEDGSEPGSGAQVLYAWDKDGKWIERAHRGTGTLTIQCESVKSKAEAHDMLDLVRDVFKNDGLSFGRLVVCGMIEQSSLQEAVPKGSGYFSVRADWKVIFAVRV